MKPLVTLLIATANEGKAAELRDLLQDLPIHMTTLEEIAAEPMSLLEGATLEENATRKAQAACSTSGLIALGDESGLEVVGLGGRPGVRSARYAHGRATDAENNAELLRALEEVDDEGRRARFRCVLALASPWFGGEVRLVEGCCEGTIARTPRGSGGFGYDPLFVVDDEDGRAMAELSEEERHRVSHRTRAVAALKPILIEILQAQLDEVERALG